MSALLLLLSDDAPPGADISFNGPMLALPYSLQRLGFTYTRNSAKTAYQNNALVTLAANQFGTTYDAVTGLHAFEAEPAATNLATNSAGAAATWIVSNVTDAGTPITGFSSSLQFGDNSVAGYAYKPVTVTSGTVYTVSVFVQMDDGNAPVVGANSFSGDFCIVSDGLNHTAPATIQRIVGNIYRVSSARTSSIGGSDRNCGTVKYTSQSARTFRAIGIQVETGSRATSYIATAGATVTRAADVLSTALTNIPGFNSAGYTLVVDGRKDVPNSGAFTAFIEVNAGDANNRSGIAATSTNLAQTYSFSAGATQSSISASAIGTTRNKIAYSVALNSMLRAVNGIAGTADLIGVMPAVLTTLSVGSRFAGQEQTNGFIYSFKLITTALNQEQTTGLTV